MVKSIFANTNTACDMEINVYVTSSAPPFPGYYKIKKQDTFQATPTGGGRVGIEAE